MIGILGGMGPLASADFFQKLVAITPAADDSDHVPVLIHSVPQLPSRPAAILRGEVSPLPDLLKARDRLLHAGATALAMPCNTAHYWYDDLLRGCEVPFIHIVDAVTASAQAMVGKGATLGIIATRGTLAGRVYDGRLDALGYRSLLPDAASQDEQVAVAITRVKEGRAAEAGDLLEPAISALLERGADVVVLACTETPIALDAIESPLRARCIDSTLALAQACLAYWQHAGQRRTSPCL